MTRLCPLLLLVTPFLACSTAVQPPMPDPVRDEELAHKELSLFYCEKKRWPSSWEEFTSWAAATPSPQVSKPGASPRDNFNNVKLTSPRAILLTVNYVDQGNTERLVSYIAPPVCRETTEPRVVTIAGERVSFVLPENFTVLGAAGIQERWKNGAYPDVVWEDAAQGIVLAVRFGEVEVAPEGLAKFSRSLERVLTKSVPKISWITKRVKSGGEQPRLIHEFESDSSRGRLVTVGMSFSFDNRLLSVNVVGPADKRAQVESMAEAVRGSLRLS